MLPRLPIDAHVARVRETLARTRAAVLVAPPGSGKTTRVPAALTADGPVFLLQPRRVAARSIARRIAEERGARLGDEVGYQVRFERRFSSSTRLLVATEGILTRRLQSDPLLSGFRTIVLDEFHERTLHADLALAFAKQAWRAREDLRLLVMSATLDAGPVARFLGDAPVIEGEARSYPVEVRHEPRLELREAVRAVLSEPGGHVLCFLPGTPEIRRAQAELGSLAGVRVLPLHGTLASEEQDAALAASAERKLILATNVAETSLTIDGVTDVIDTGLHKVLRYDAARGLDRLELERISRDSAEQRAGRAGRTGPGRVIRLWDARDVLRPRREPEIERVDLLPPLLEVLAWGADPASFEWFEAPSAPAIAAGLRLLERLDACEHGRLTAEGRDMHRLPVHPRLARVLLAAGGERRAAAACAVLAEGWRPHHAGDPPTTESDVLSAADRVREAPGSVRAVAEELGRLVSGGSGREGADRTAPYRAEADRTPAHGRVGGNAHGREARRLEGENSDERLLRALLAGYPDRVARRREPGSSRVVLASGTGATLARESGVRDGELLIAVVVTGGEAGASGEALVRMASRVEREWLAGVTSDKVHRFDPSAAAVRAVLRDSYDALVLGERDVAPDRDASGEVLAAELRRRGLGAAGQRLERRLRFAALEVDLEAALVEACRGQTRLPALEDPERWLDARTRHELSRLAPERIPLPSGRTAALEYRDDGSVRAAVKLQELFGLGESPRVGRGGASVVLELLAPNGRPVQTTSDLRSFWQSTYPEVRKELRGRYPRHPWPEDPWIAEPTQRAKKRR